MPDAVQGMKPAEIAALYDFPPSTGKGCRIAILSFAGGFHERDLTEYWQQQGIHPTVTTQTVDVGLYQGTNAPYKYEDLQAFVQKVDQPGKTFQQLFRELPFDDVGFCRGTIETTMDIQIAGALAPDATIEVWFGFDNPDGWAETIRKALDSKPTVMSISWGKSEYAWGTDNHAVWTTTALDAIHDALAAARHLGVTVCCSTGDTGTLTPTAEGAAAGVHFPASSPWTLACGGTSPQLRDGRRTGDRAWKQCRMQEIAATGGGMSGYFPRPSWQILRPGEPSREGLWTSTGTPFEGRWLPDVAGPADYQTGYQAWLGGQPLTADGTSAAAPFWAALLARCSEHLGRPVGWINELLYSGALDGGFDDVTAGDNGVPDASVTFHAGPGWDACTGFGVPNGRRLLAALEHAGVPRAR